MNISSDALRTWLANLSRPYPARDWLIVLSISGMLCALGFMLAAYLFFGVQTGTLIDSSSEVPRAPIPVTKEAITSVLDSYQVRAANFANKTFPAVDLLDPRARAVKK